MSSAAETRCDVSVVVPLYRTADTVEELCERIASLMAEQRWSYELILVNDGSPDDDLAAARRAADRDAVVCVLDLDRNRGQNTALLVGLTCARGSWAVILDGDLQDPPDAIPRLLEEGRLGFDAVFGGRHGRYEPWYRLLSSRVFKTTQSILCGVPRDAGLFAALSASLVRDLTAWPVDAPKLVPMIGLLGRPVTSVPVERQKRPRGATAYSGWRRLRVAVSILAFAARWRWALEVDSGPVDRSPMIARRFGSCIHPERTRAK